MKTIDTLIEDIYALFDGKHIFDTDSDKKFAQKFTEQVLSRMSPKEDREFTLRMSNIGDTCERKLWYECNEPEGIEPLGNDVRLKFLFGDMYEEFLLFLAEEAGHTVEGRQDEVDVYGVKGHRDAVIDGVLVDVKSASGFGFKKFKEHALLYDDSFGYIPQLMMYLEGAQDDDIVTEKNRAAFFVVDKSTGEITLDFYDKTDPGVGWEKYVQNKRDMLSSATPPDRLQPVPQNADNPKGNKKIQIKCEYCWLKDHCWKGVARKFQYSKYVAYLPEVVKTPRVPEII